jgi:DNA replication protein DnaC
MADDVQDWLARFCKCQRDGAKLLVISGQSGTGKTHVAERMKGLASRLGISLWETGQWSNPPLSLLDEWAPVAALEYRDYREWLEELSRIDIVFLEDVGAETDRFKSSEPTERLREVLNACKNKWLMVTTNLLPEQWPVKWDERVADRFMRESKVVTLRNVPRYTAYAAAKGKA